MARLLVTGAAGFIGSHLVERLVADGHSVTGLDALRRPGSDRYLRALAAQSDFRMVVGDIAEVDLSAMLRGIDGVFHLAGRPGVRDSWGSQFPEYVRDNLVSTQRLAEAAVAAGGPRLVFASTSSVYGTAPMPFAERGPTRPVSPYGVSKLSAEVLLGAYAANFGLPVVILRYFTVYGPRQRPDMAFTKWFGAVSRGEEVTLYGPGSRRDFTYVGDAVAATVLAMSAPPGRTYNVASGAPVDVGYAVREIGSLCGRRPSVRLVPRPAGDPPATWADIGAAGRELGYRPRVPLAEGLLRQWEWWVQEKAGDG